ncbi:MAG: hypothetical protein H7A39_02360 [Chlamydiales bacterium]|nr:hypothetical protein [Chlamydiales bacterium]
MSNWEEQEKKWEKQFIVLLEAGYIACNQADEDSALKLFKAAKLLKPQNTLCDVGVGYLHLHKLELQQACLCFEGVIKKEPDNEMAHTLLGVAKSMMPQGSAEGEKILHKMSQGTKDPYVKQLSDTAIDFVDRFIKGDSNGPANVKKPKQPNQ